GGSRDLRASDRGLEDSWRCRPPTESEVRAVSLASRLKPVSEPGHGASLKRGRLLRRQGIGQLAEAAEIEVHREPADSLADRGLCRVPLPEGLGELLNAAHVAERNRIAKPGSDCNTTIEIDCAGRGRGWPIAPANKLYAKVSVKHGKE